MIEFVKNFARQKWAAVATSPATTPAALSATQKALADVLDAFRVGAITAGEAVEKIAKI